MKILHTADVHLGAKNIRLTLDRQAFLKEQQLKLLKAMFDRAYDEDFDAILICGDLFHTKNLPAKVLAHFYSAVENYQRPVLYVKGNHDEKFDFSALPKNFIVLDENRPFYKYQNVVFWGQIDILTIQNSIDYNNINVLLLHGNIKNKNDRDYVDLQSYASLKFDYIALGHVHSYEVFNINNTVASYPGSLFSNGFDEAGDKGYVEVNLEKNKVAVDFKNLPSSRYMLCRCDITDLEVFQDILAQVKNSLSSCNKRDIVRLILTGYVSENCNKFIYELNNVLSDYFYIEIIDNTKLKIDYDKIKNEELSFKAEFLLLVENSEEDDFSKNKICQLGIEALRGDDISL